MARVIKYDQVTLRVLEDIKSANTPDYNTRPDCLIEPKIVVGSMVPIKYWKVVVVANEVLEMTDSEKTQVENDLVAAKLAQDRVSASKLDFPLVDVIVALIKRINVRVPNNPVTKQEIVDQLKQDKGL